MENVKKLVLMLNLYGNFLPFPLSLLINLNEPVIFENKMYIKLCFDFLFGEIKNAGLGLSYFGFELMNTECSNYEGTNFIEDFGIVASLSYLEINERRKMLQVHTEHIVQQITFIDVKSDANNPDNKSKYFAVAKLPFSNISKGLFIECENVDDIQNITFTVNDQKQLNYNKLMLKLKCQKINASVLYIPFTPFYISNADFQQAS